MNIYLQLEKEHSKRNATYLADYIGNDSDKFAELIQLFFGTEYRTTQRAAHTMSHCVDRHPELIHPYIERMITALTTNPPVAIKRNIVRLLQHQNIPEVLQGTLTDICFNYLLDAKETIAVKAFSMTILYQLSLLYPDLSNELEIVITDVVKNGSAGLINRGNKILKLLKP